MALQASLHVKNILEDGLQLLKSMVRVYAAEINKAWVEPWKQKRFT